ncbi:divalent-cation tolerance protein CutA [Chloroflexota bacterium]
MQYHLIYVTTQDEAEAREIGRTLVEERLAACVNIFPIKSIYRWQGTIEEAGEVAMFIKTRAELADKIIKRVKELHSYEVPCIVSLPIEKGYPDYLKWIEESTSE